MGIGMALAPLLQVRRILVRRHAGDISQMFMWVIVVGAACWTAYGLVKPDWYLAVPNLVAVFTNLGTVLLARHFVRLATLDPGSPQPELA